VAHAQVGLDLGQQWTDGDDLWPQPEGDDEQRDGGQGKVRRPVAVRRPPARGPLRNG